MVVIGSAGVLAPGKWRWLRALGWMAALTVAQVVTFNGIATAALLLLDPSGEAGAGSKLAAAIAA